MSRPGHARKRDREPWVVADDSRVSLEELKEPNASVVDWIAVVAGSVGALMAVLDISITNAALPEIQGELGANGTEGTWMATGYLVAEVVMIPLTAWFTRLFGLRRFLLVCTAFFTLFSVFCGLAHSLPQMVAGRMGQGFTGGAMIPTAQTIVATRLPRHQIPLGMTVFGLIVLLGPIFGPVSGGWLAENVDWHWCFFINLPVGMALFILLMLGLPTEKTNFRLLRHGDWFGMLGLTLGLSALTVVLEEGQRDRWFESTFICVLSAVSLFGLTLLAITQFTSPEPIIKLKLLRIRAFAGVCAIAAIIGIILYGVLYLIPQFLGTISGYNSEQAGLVLVISGIPAMLLIPFLPRMLGRINIRLMTGTGIVLIALSCVLDSSLTVATGGGDFTVTQFLRGFGQILASMPLNQSALAAVPIENASDASGLFNMARNLGGSIGLALMGALIDQRTQLHVERINESVTANSPRAAELMQSMGGANGSLSIRAAAQIAAEVFRQATVLTYSDCFWMLAIATVVTLPFILMLRQPRGFVSMRR
jgi:DHA2 family multidrug resistance protein